MGRKSKNSTEELVAHMEQAIFSMSEGCPVPTRNELFIDYGVNVSHTIMRIRLARPDLYDEYLRLAARESPHLVVLAMGMPRQERLARALRAAAQGPCLIICGGAIADFLGGRYARAPRWLQRLGLEWCWRLAREPRRLFGRYVLGNPLFLARALWLALSRRQPAAASPSARS